jgi:16S rRNA (adenine1518-N6/adenine1519-N6)-dimethyltransferase
MKLSEMKRILAEDGIQLTKSLGQNFLHDGNQLDRIIGLADLKKTDRVLEIGPGLGPLTERLLQKAGHVFAIEKDARLVTVLKRRLADALIADLSPASIKGGPVATLGLLLDDALEFLTREAHDWADWKLVANLPYSVASPILVELSQASRPPSMMVATLQLEVARRLMAVPDTADYGVLTVLIQSVFRPSEWFKIPAGSFFPEPEIDSACVCLARRQAPLVAPGDLQRSFTRVVKRGFSQRRKMMLKLLKQDWSTERLQPAFEAARIPPTARAEDVTPEQFAILAASLASPKP